MADCATQNDVFKPKVYVRLPIASTKDILCTKGPGLSNSDPHDPSAN
jgi:hypothetical protein